MRIDSTQPLTNFTQLFRLKKFPPSPLKDSLAQAPATKRQTCFPLAYWKKGPFEIFVTFDLQKRAIAKVYQNGLLLTIPIHFHLPLDVTRSNLRQAQQTLSQMSLSTHYEGRTLYLTPHLRLCGGMPQKQAEEEPIQSTRSLAAKEDAAHAHLALACIQAFETGLKRPQDIAELAELARSQKAARPVLAALLKPLKEKMLLDPMLLQGLARALEYADSQHLSHTDLVAILDYLNKRISKLSSTDEQRLIQELAALSSLLDAMVAADVSGLDRKQIHKAVMQEIALLTRHRSKEVALLAQSCEQALVRLPSDESKVHRILRRALHMGEGASLLAHAWHDKSIGSAIKAFQEFYEAFKPEKGKKKWYESVQFAKLLISQGEYKEASKIVATIPKENLYLIQLSIYALPKQERSVAAGHLPALPPCALHPLPKAGETLICKARTTLPWRLHMLKQERLALSEEEKLYIPLDGRRNAHSQERLDLIEEVDSFFASDQTVLLIQGGSGAGKSTFLRTLERRCWEQEGFLPLHIRLGKIDPKSPHIIEDALASLHFKEEQIAELKTRRLVIFLDGYDEMVQGQRVNLYEHGGIKGWNAQAVISCRSQHLANSDQWERYFAPFEGEMPNLKKLHTLHVAPFSESQVHSYLERYLEANPTPGWTAERFTKTIEAIKGLKELIEVPFILRITAEVLPTIIQDELPANLILTRRILYDAFVDLWFERQEKKLRASGQEVPQDFKRECLHYCQNLATAMVKERVVEVRYDPMELFATDRAPSKWEKFLGPTAFLFKAAAPLTKTAGGYAFIHKSFLEHFASKAAAVQLIELSQPKQDLAHKQSKHKRPTRPQAKRYTTFDIENTCDLAKRWQEHLSPEEKETLYNLAIETIEAFSLQPCTEEILEEMIPLAAIPDADLVRRLLEQLICPLDQDVMVDLRLVRCLSRAVALIDIKSIDPSHFTSCVDVLHKRVISLHKTKSDEALIDHLHALEQLTAALLDHKVLVSDTKVKELLESLKKIPCSNLQVHAAYSSLKQALLRLNTDEERLSDWLQRGKYIAKGISALIESVGSYSPKKAVEGLVAFKEAVKTKGQKERWYEEIRTAHLVIQADDINTYRQMQLKPKESHVQLALVTVLERGVRTTDNEMVRTAWIEEILSLGRSNPKIHGYIHALVESYAFYDAPEVRRLCSQANFPQSQEKWMHLYLPSSHAHHALLAKAKRFFSWRLAQLKTTALNDPTMLQERSYHVPLDAAYHASSTHRFPLDQGVRDFLSGNKRMLLLMGDSGSGKSLSMKMLAADLWREHKEGNPIPLFISLTGAARTTTTLIEDALKKEGFSTDQIVELKGSHDFIFILDGFDEMSGTEVHNLLTTNNLLSWRGKVIITCRTQYAWHVLGNYKEHFMPYDDAGVAQTSLYEEITTAPFTSEQIERYLTQFCAQTDISWTCDVYLRYIDSIPKVREMIENPFVLHILVEALPSIVEKHGADDVESLRLTRADFYEAFVRSWFDRQLDKLIRGGWSDLSQSEVEKYYTYAVKLASQMHIRGMSEVRYHPSKQEENPFAPFFADDPPLLVRARTACPLVIIREEGEIIYRFLHKSLLEFLGGRNVFDEATLSTEGLAEALAAVEPIENEPEYFDALETMPEHIESQHTDAEAMIPINSQHIDLEQIIASPLNQHLFTQEMGTLRFWVDDVQQNLAFRKQLLAIIDLSKTHPEVEVAAANAITILVGAEHSFAYADLRGIRVRGALLDKGNFENADLSDADLGGCSLQGAILFKANCEGTHLEEIDWGPRLILKGDKKISSVAYSPDGKRIVSGIRSSVQIWDAHKGTSLCILTGHTDKVNAIAYNSDGKRIASASDDRTVRIWDAHKGISLFTLTGHTDKVNAIAYNSDRKRIASASDDKTVRIWDAHKGTSLCILTGHTDKVNAIAYNSDGKRIASASDDKTVRIWDAHKGTSLCILKHEGSVTSVTYSPKRAQLATGCLYNICVWNAIQGTVLFTIPDCSGSLCVTYSPDGKNFASANSLGMVELWDAIQGTLLFSFHNLLNYNLNLLSHISLAYNPMGREIALVTAPRIVEIWSTEKKSLLAPITRKINLSKEMNKEPSRLEEMNIKGAYLEEKDRQLLKLSGAIDTSSSLAMNEHEPGELEHESMTGDYRWLPPETLDLLSEI